MRRVLWASFAVTTATVFACGPSAPPASASPAAAALSTPRAIERLFRAPHAEARWFAPSFIADNSIERTQDLLDVVHLTLGDYQGVRGGGPEYVVRFSAGERSVRAKVDEEGRFVVLLIGPSGS